LGRGRALWRDAVGPIVVLIGICLVENFTHNFPDLPEPAPMILAFVAISGFLTSVNSAVLSSLIAMAYALVFVAHRHHTSLPLCVESMYLACAAPVLAITGALMRQHANRTAETLKKHLSNTPLGVIELYADYEISLWAGSAESIFGIAAKEAVGKNLFDVPGIFLSEKDREEIQGVLEELQRGSRSRAVVQTLSESKGGGRGHSRWFWSTTLRASGVQTRFLVLVEDITPRVRAEQQLERSKTEIIERLVRASEHRDDDTGIHVVRMARYCEALAEALGLPQEQCHFIWTAAPMHDIGKIGIPDRILLKDGKLTEEEFEVIKTHTTIGADVLSGSTLELVQMAERIALTHHERWDGTGYPHGLKGEEIPLEGRICAICDVFDALTSDRPYKQAWPLKEAIAQIKKGAGNHFDPRLVEVFLSILPRIKAIRDEYDLQDQLRDRKTA
jgi:PAS domain S-box-containing protein